MFDIVNSINGQIIGFEIVYKCIFDIEVNNNLVFQRYCNILEINGYQCFDRGDVILFRQYYMFN